MAVLNAVKTFGLLTADQIRRLLFHDHKSVVSAQNVMRRRLRILFEEHCLNRWYFSLNDDAVYRLDTLGVKILQATGHHDVSRKKYMTMHRLALMAHTLGIAEFAVSLTEGAREMGGDVYWVGESRLTLKVSNEDYFEPDGAGVLHLPGKSPVAFFLEWDRGTEPLAQFAGKMSRYRKYHLNRNWAGAMNRMFPSFKITKWPPMVVVTTGGVNRMVGIIRYITRYLTGLNITPDNQPVYVTNTDLLQRKGMLGDVFFQPGKVTKDNVIWEKGISLTDV